MSRAPSTFRQQDVTKAVKAVAAAGVDIARHGAHARSSPMPSSIRFRIEPRDIPMSKAARRLHLTLDEFRAMLPNLIARGFPSPDPTTGHFYLPAIDKWMEARSGLTAANLARDDSNLIDERLERVPWGT